MNDFEKAISITQHTYKHIANIYANEHTVEAIPLFWQKRIQDFADYVHASPAYQANPETPILDMGCGPGRDALLFAQRGFSVHACDLSEAMLDEARKRTHGLPQAERITFQQMDMQNIPLHDNTYAGIWVSASFLHIPKSENMHVLQEFIRVLAAGSPLLLTVKEQRKKEAERFETYPITGQQRFFAYYRGAELWQLLEEAGLEVQGITTDRDTRPGDRERWLAALAVRKSV